MDNVKNTLKDYLKEMGFEVNLIDEVLKMTNDLDEATNLLVQMREENNNILDYKNIVFDYKMVIIVRDDIKMSRGKLAAQVGHGVLEVYKQSINLNNKYVQEWEKIGVKKIVLKVPNEEIMMQKYNLALSKKIPTVYITDAGRTELEPFTKTVCAFGPWISNELDEITGDLKLLK